MFSYASAEELFKWCKVPPEELTRHPQAKVKITIVPTAQAMYEDFANTLVDEVKTDITRGKPTRWVLPCGPRGQYSLFAARVNRERIPLKNVHVFHMDDNLDWQGRHLPFEHSFSLEGWMRRNFYGLIDPELNVPPEQRHFPRVSQLDDMTTRIK